LALDGDVVSFTFQWLYPGEEPMVPTEEEVMHVLEQPACGGQESISRGKDSKKLL
jgi:hypothetical protein